MSNLKTANVMFADKKYNYSTSVNGNLSDEELKNYFIGNSFNMGGIRYIKGVETEIDDLQMCIDCTITD